MVAPALTLCLFTLNSRASVGRNDRGLGTTDGKRTRRRQIARWVEVRHWILKGKVPPTSVSASAQSPCER